MKTFGSLPPNAPCIKRPGSYGLIFDDRQHVLLVETGRPDRLYLPGGGIEAGESPEEALLRELREETGYEVKVLEDLGRAANYFFVPNRNLYCLKIGHFFRAEVIGGHPGLKVEDDHTVHWMPASAALPKLAHPSEHYVLQQWWQPAGRQTSG